MLSIITEIILNSMDALDEDIEDILSPTKSSDENQADPSPVVVNAGMKPPPDDLITDNSLQEMADTI